MGPLSYATPEMLQLPYKPNGGQARTIDMYPTEKVYQDIPISNLPGGWTHWTGKYGPQVEDPQAQYPNSMMPCIDSIFGITVENDTVNGKLVVPAAGIAQIELFSAGQGDSGTPVGVYWKLGPGDSTLQKGGAFVFSNNTFVAFGHTVGLEFLARRGGDPDAPSSTDPVIIDSLYQNGWGNYYSLLSTTLGFRVGLTFAWQGDQAPKFMGNLAFNGDSSQATGGGLVAMSAAVNGAGRYIPWERQFLIGPRDSYTKAFASLSMSNDIELPYIEENPPPAGNLLMVYRLRVFGGRKCGELTPGCPNIVTG